MSPFLRRLAAWLSGDRLTIASAVTGVVGVLLVVLAQDKTFDWTRVFGALLVSLSGIGFGVRFGFAEPLRGAFAGTLLRWRGWIAAAVIVLLVAPVVVGLAALLVGVVKAAGNESGWGVALGALLGAVMLAGMLVSGWTAARSVIGAGGEAVTNAHPALGDEDERR